MSEPLVITSGLPRVDRCPVLTRVKAYVGQQGVRATLEHQFVDGAGNPLDLETLVPGIDGTLSISESESESVSPVGSVVARARLAGVSSAPNCREPIYEFDAVVRDAGVGLVRAQLPLDLVQRAALYELFFAVRDEDDTVLHVSRSLLSIEHTLFAENPFSAQKTKGPPTIQEIRMFMRDSHRHENLLLDDLEFGDEQILDAVLTPVNMWNEALPPIRPFMTTANFPYREQWKSAIVGRLFVTASHGYRRNQLSYQAGGTAVNDQEKERQYAEAGLRLLEEYRRWVSERKMAINVGRVVGYVGSDYGG